MRLIGDDPLAEQRRQGALLDILADRFEGDILAELVATSTAMVDHFELTGEVPIDAGHTQRLTAIYLAMADASIGTFATRILRAANDLRADIKGGPITLERKDFASTLRDWARSYIEAEAIRQRISDVTNTTRNIIVRAVSRGFEDGLGQRGIADYVRWLVPNLSQARAGLIARTETHGAAQHGAQAAAAETGLKLRREWIAAEDHRTRFTHAIANGQTVGMDEPFIVGLSELSMPGDPKGPPAEILNCRCVTGYIVIEDEEEATPPAAPAVSFAYESLKAPRTTAELNAFAIANGIAGHADLKGLPVVNTGKALLKAAEIVERFGLAPLTAVGPVTRFGMKSIRGAGAAVVRTYGRVNGVNKPISVLHLPTTFGSGAAAQQQFRIAAKNVPTYLKDAEAAIVKLGAKADHEAVARMARLTASSKDYTWAIYAEKVDAESAITTMSHEFGHVLHLIDDRIGAKINAFLLAEKPREGGWQYLVSKYGGSNDKEYIAETFAIYMDGDESQFYRIHPKLLAIYKSEDKKK